MEKIKLLFYGDSPTVNTGFATVSKNILKRLQATGKYDITVLGINYFGDPHDLPYKIYPAIDRRNDVYGRKRLLELLKAKDFDILFTLQDTFIMATIGKAIKKIKKDFKWIYYYPIDVAPQEDWIKQSVAYCDVAIPYTKYAKKESEKILKRDYEVIYHGYDKDDFYIMSDEEKNNFKNKFFKDNNDTFFIININRNQERKGYLQTLLAFKLFNNIVPRSTLYTHCDVANDRGGNLIQVAKQIGLANNWIYPNPEIFKKGISFPTKYINGLYNIADVNISTTYGEGFGLSMVEAMATKTLNIFPDNTAIKEIIGKDRGLLVKSGNTPNNLIANGHLDNNVVRPVTDVVDMVNKLLWAYKNKEGVKKIEETAYIWAKENLDWDKIGEKFNKLIIKAYGKN
ncbi:MAG TPA: glycosyltransferase family 1 protein [Bacteroidetes bacterium]|nr:glycosyltransferase family 1 protein [Bacteroidota bacterium]